MQWTDCIRQVKILLVVRALLFDDMAFNNPSRCQMASGHYTGKEPRFDIREGINNLSEDLSMNLMVERPPVSYV